MTPTLAPWNRTAKRRDRRFGVAQPALVSFSACPDLVWTARIADISRRGMMLILDQQPIQEGDVIVRWHDRSIPAVVRNCEPVGNVYRLGVELIRRSGPLLVEMLAREKDETAAAC